MTIRVYCNSGCDYIYSFFSVESVVTDAMINEETTLLKAAEAEEAKTRPLVFTMRKLTYILRKAIQLWRYPIRSML